MNNSLIILDRDGVINKLITRQDGIIDSPMSIDEIDVFPWVTESIDILTNKLGCKVAIATNQPAASKGKISKENLIKINDTIIARAFPKTSLNVFVCWHKTEDNCNCRKPKTGMLENAFLTHKECCIKKSWMVGDRATDIIAGYNFKLKTALLGPSVNSDMEILNKSQIFPTYHGTDLRDFIKAILKGKI